MKPNYCSIERNENCHVCSLSSYGRDCQNNLIPIVDEDYIPSNWELASKHGLGNHALSNIRALLPEWVFDLEPEKIGELIMAMHTNHQHGITLATKDIDDFFGFPFWLVNWSVCDIDNLPRMEVTD